MLKSSNIYQPALQRHLMSVIRTILLPGGFNLKDLYCILGKVGSPSGVDDRDNYYNFLLQYTMYP